MDKFRRMALFALILVIIVCTVVAVRAIFGGSEKVLVPQLTGMQLQEASEALEKLGLSARIEKTESAQADGTVISQEPEAGKKVVQGTSLLLKVSGSAAQIKVPDVRYLSREEAVRKLEQAGFRAGKILQVADTSRNDGTVLAQNPSAGQKISAGESVELLVCTGGAAADGFVNVPDLRGKTKEEAEAALQQAGLLCGECTDSASSAKEGTVISTKPSIGTRVSAGDSINLVLAAAQEQKNEPAVHNTAEVTKESTVRAVKPEVRQQPEKKVKEAEKTAPAAAEKAAEKKAPAKADAAAKKTQPANMTAVKNEAASSAKPVSAKTETKAAAQQPAQTAEKTAAAKPSSSAAAQSPLKTAKIRYVVPPLSSPLALKITMTDADGTHVIKDITAKGNEVISMPVQYKDKAGISIMLGGETVWQENCR